MTTLHKLFTPILVSGADARSFLQGQLTCDMNDVSRENAMLAACASPQGRIQAVFSVQEVDTGMLLTVTTAVVDRLLQRLRRYVLRAKVSIDDASTDFPNCWRERFAPPGVQRQRNDGTTESLLLDEIRTGIPHVFPETYEAFVAQMLNLDSLGAVSFNKGCYTGQEIIARAHFRGAVKRRMFRFSADCPPPDPATRFLCSGEHAGDVVYAAPTATGCELLAVVNLARADSVIQLEDSASTRVKRLDLPYAPQ